MKDQAQMTLYIARQLNAHILAVGSNDQQNCDPHSMQE